MISGTILLKKIKNGKHRENLRSETYSVAAKGKKNCGVWERNAEHPRTYPVTVALEIEGIETQYCVMPVTK